MNRSGELITKSLPQTSLRLTEVIMYKRRLISKTVLLTVLIFACGKDNEPELGQESSEN